MEATTPTGSRRSIEVWPARIRRPRDRTAPPPGVEAEAIDDGRISSAVVLPSGLPQLRLSSAARPRLPLDGVGDLEQIGGPFAGGEARPGGLRGGGGGDRRIHLAGRGFRRSSRSARRSPD